MENEASKFFDKAAAPIMDPSERVSQRAITDPLGLATEKVQKNKSERRFPQGREGEGRMFRETLINVF